MCPLYSIGASFNQKKKKTFETRFLQKKPKKQYQYSCSYISLDYMKKPVYLLLQKRKIDFKNRIQLGIISSCIQYCI